MKHNFKKYILVDSKLKRIKDKNGNIIEWFCSYAEALDYIYDNFEVEADIFIDKMER